MITRYSASAVKNYNTTSSPCRELFEQECFLTKKTIVAQGCQTAYFETKNPNLSKFWRVSDWKVLVNYISIRYTYFMDIWYILWLYLFLVLVCCTKKNLATLYVAVFVAVVGSIRGFTFLDHVTRNLNFYILRYFFTGSVMPFPIGFCYRQAAILL
jgi:hypothetical protein